MTNFELGACANGIDDCDTFKAGKMGQFRQFAVSSSHDVEIGGVDGRSKKLDGHLASGRGSSRYFDLSE